MPMPSSRDSMPTWTCMPQRAGVAGDGAELVDHVAVAVLRRDLDLVDRRRAPCRSRPRRHRPRAPPGRAGGVPRRSCVRASAMSVQGSVRVSSRCSSSSWSTRSVSGRAPRAAPRPRARRPGPVSGSTSRNSSSTPNVRTATRPSSRSSRVGVCHARRAQWRTPLGRVVATGMRTTLPDGRRRGYCRDMATSVYVAAVEGFTGKSTVALGVLEQLSRRVERVAVYRPVVRGDAATDYVLDLLVSHDAVQLTYDECAGVTYADLHRDPEARARPDRRPVPPGRREGRRGGRGRQRLHRRGRADGVLVQRQDRRQPGQSRCCWCSTPTTARPRTSAPPPTWRSAS